MTQTTTEKCIGNHSAPERIREGRTYVPAVDIIEKPDELLLLADVPGARAEDIDVRFEKGLLTILAKAEPRQDSRTSPYVLREYGVGDFERSFELGESIDASRIAAEVQNGVLWLHLPKAESLKPRKISVKPA